MYPSCSDLVWIGRSQRDFNEFPRRVREELVVDIRAAQRGLHPTSAKPLRGFNGASVLELRAKDAGGTYRVVYTVRIQDRLCILHCFQKKSSSGITTSKQDMDIIKQRLGQAEKEYGK